VLAGNRIQHGIFFFTASNGVEALRNHYCTNFEKRYPIGVCTAKLIEYIELSTVVHKRNEALDGRYLRKSNLKGRGLFPTGKRSMIRFKEEIAEWAQIDAPAGAENDVHGTNDQEGTDVGALYNQLASLVGNAHVAVRGLARTGATPIAREL
jgi:hypothetical protein